MFHHNYVVIDLETTGLDPLRDRIIEIAAVRLEKGNITARLHSLINPGRPIPPYIQKLTGITDAMVRQAPSLADVLPSLNEVMASAIPVGHNGNFDLAFLNHARGTGTRPQPLLDTLALSRILFPCLPSYRLDFLSQKFGLEPRQHHRALGDVLTTVQLLRVLWQATLDLDRHLLAGMEKIAPPGLKPWFQAAMMTAPPAATTAEVAASGLFAPEQTAATPPAVPPEFCPETIAAILAPEGLLAKKLGGYEYRPQQAVMLKAVAAALAGNQHLIVEAGTGTGKSLAYLLPAIYWACYRGKRVAIATHTISLQEQLMRKDLPLLKEILPFPFKAALIKGRNNYLCRRKLRDCLNNPPPGDMERGFILRVMRWAKTTATGDLGEMKLTPEEEGYRYTLSAEKETCAGSSCPYNDACFVNAARREAEAARILVLNHSLLLSDIRLHNQVLPDYPYLIIDEAHHLEDAATEHLGTSIRQASCTFYLNRLGRQAQPFSFLNRAGALARRLTATGNTELYPLLEDLEVTVARSQEQWQAFWDALGELSNAALWEQNSSTLRFTARLKETPAWDNLIAAFGCLEETLAGLCGRLARLAELLAGVGAQEMAADAANLAGIFAGYSRDLGEVLDADPDTSVSWLEKNSAGQYTLYVAPLEIGPLLAELLFQQKQAVILTSATITVDGSFDFYRQQVGLASLPHERTTTCQVASPFDYQSQALVCAVRGLPNPGQLSDNAYAAAVAPVITQVLAAIDGRAMILCTSHRFLRDIYDQLAGMLVGSDFNILAQGIDGSRSQLLEEFRQTTRAVLLGANSYWEGIDLPGDLLRCVIIPRLPFPSPGVPVHAARIEYNAARKLNPFTTLSLPQAIIRFRQGFGRLIRNSGDRGVMVVLDQRLLSQRYGRHFLRSLPPVTTAEITPAELPTRIAAWFKDTR